MNELLNQYYATDKDIFDLLISGRQRLTDGVLRELAKDRGIFYSPYDSRDDLAEKLSLLPHDFEDVSGLMHRREGKRRGEKTTSITFDTELTADELKDAVAEYQKDVGVSEKVSSHQKGAKGFSVNVEYDEIDYSRTRLIQRQKHDAAIEFVHEGGKTVVRLPATEKAKHVVSVLTEKIEGKRKATMPKELIELVGIADAEGRTSFFTKLISTMSGYRMKDVTNLRVASTLREEIEDGADLDEDRDLTVEHEMLAYVRSMALTGQNLVASREYQQLRMRGFFITSITWRAEQLDGQPDIFEFSAEFEDFDRGTGFKYAVRGVCRFQDGQHMKTMKHVEDHERARLFGLIEDTAHSVLAALRAVDAENKLATGSEVS